MRVEQARITTAGQMFNNLTSYGLRGEIASELYYHEKAHADADEERRGDFGFEITSGWVVAYYIIIGERTPEQLMKIASAPGFSQMSAQDSKIYNKAKQEYLAEFTRKRHEERYVGVEKMSNMKLKVMLTEILSKKLNNLSENDSFPQLEEILKGDYRKFYDDYGAVLHQAYKEAVYELGKYNINVEAGNTD